MTKNSDKDVVQSLQQVTPRPTRKLPPNLVRELCPRAGSKGMPCRVDVIAAMGQIEAQMAAQNFGIVV